MSGHLGGAVGLSLAASTMWGMGDFAGGLASKRAASNLVVAVAHGSSLLLVLLYALVSRATLPSTHTFVLGLAGGAAGGAGLVLFYAVLATGAMGITASVAGVVTAALPVVVSCLTENLAKPTQLTGFVAACVAIWIIAAQPGARADLRSILLAATCGLCFGTQLIFLRLADHGALWPLASSRISSTGIAILVSLIGWLRRPSEGHLGRNGLDGKVIGIAVMAGVLDSGGNALYTTAATLGRLDVAAVLSSLYPAVTILLAMGFLGERASRRQAVGMTLALAAVGLISI